MSDIENVQAKAAGPEQKQAPKKSRFLPSWWVKQPKPEKVKKPLKQEIIEWGVTLVVALSPCRWMATACSRPSTMAS